MRMRLSSYIRSPLIYWFFPPLCWLQMASVPVVMTKQPTSSATPEEKIYQKSLEPTLNDPVWHTCPSQSTGTDGQTWITGPCPELSRGRVVSAPSSPRPYTHTEEWFPKGEQKKRGSDIRIKAGWQVEAADDYYEVLLCELEKESFVFNLQNNEAQGNIYQCSSNRAGCSGEEAFLGALL